MNFHNRLSKTPPPPPLAPYYRGRSPPFSCSFLLLWLDAEKWLFPHLGKFAASSPLLSSIRRRLNLHAILAANSETRRRGNKNIKTAQDTIAASPEEDQTGEIIWKNSSVSPSLF